MIYFLIFMAIAAAVPIAFLPGDWAGWIFLYASFAVVPFLLFPRRKMPVILAIWATLLGHHAIAIYNAYVGLVPGADMDALNFQHGADLLSRMGGFRFGVGAPFYTNCLGALYAFFGASTFLGEEASILAYSLSCVVMVKLMDLLEIERYQAVAILIFGLLPGVAVFTSVTLRESWQILFFVSCVYALLRFRMTADPRALSKSVGAGFCMGLLHNGLMAYALVLIPYGLLFRLGARKSLSLPRLLAMGLAGFLLLGIIGAVATNSIPKTPMIQAITEGETLEYAAKYRRNSAHNARASYGVALETGSAGAFVRSLSLLYLYYFFAPFPWQIAARSDVIAFLDVWVRFAMIVFMILAWRSRQGMQAQLRRFLITLYFSMSLLWAMGTINYGTAIRHHIIAVWIVVLLGVPEAAKRLERVFA